MTVKDASFGGLTGASSGRRGMATSILAVLLAGCASGVPVERVAVVPGGRFADVRGEAALTVRTFVEDPQGERREVAGATCDVVSSLYTTRLVTPSRLVVPNFGPQSPQIGVSCRAGELTGAGRTRIVTRWVGPPGYWGYPYGPAFGGPFGPWGWYGPSVPVSDYPDLNVGMR